MPRDGRSSSCEKRLEHPFAIPSRSRRRYYVLCKARLRYHALPCVITHYQGTSKCVKLACVIMHYKCLRGGGTRRARATRSSSNGSTPANPERRAGALALSLPRVPLASSPSLLSFLNTCCVRRTCSFSIQKYTLNFTDHDEPRGAGRDGRGKRADSEASSRARQRGELFPEGRLHARDPEAPAAGVVPGLRRVETVRPPAPTAAMGGPSPARAPAQPPLRGLRRRRRRRRAAFLAACPWGAAGAPPPPPWSGQPAARKTRGSTAARRRASRRRASGPSPS